MEQTELEAAAAFRAFQRDKAKQDKAVEELRGANAEQLAAFADWRAQQDAKDQEQQTQKRPTTASAGGVSTTDAVLSERVAENVIKGRFCWSSALGWLRWTGQRWESTNQHLVTEAVRQYMVESVARKLREPETDWKQRQELMSLLGKSRLVALVELAKGMDGVQVRAEVFDTDPDLLNTPSGVVHLPTGELRPHDPGLYLTRMTRVPYRPGATHPDWDKALQALPSDVADWFQVRSGQAITGYMTPDDIMLILQGGGENGKSTILESISRALGDSGDDAAAGYCCPMSDRVLLANPGDHPTELMDLRGSRLAVAEELPEARRLNVKRLKDTVGTSTMKARRMKADPISWSATHSIFLSTNYVPAVEETDHGTWRRLLLVKFPYRYLKPGVAPSAPHERVGDPGIRERMKNGTRQAEAVLAWLVEGARRWYAADRIMPPHPESVAADTLKWRTESDLVLAYWLDRIEADRESHVYSQDLFSDFNTWLHAHGHREWSDKTFGSRFEGHEHTASLGIVRKKIRAQSGLSRPGDQWNPAAVPTSYRAWLGLRFVKD